MVGLYFWFVLETVLITGRFCYCWAVLTQRSVYTEHKPVLPHPTNEQAGGTKTADQGTRGISHTVWCHAQQQSWGNRKEGEDSQWWCLPSQVTVMCVGAWFSWKCLNPCLSIGSGEWISCFLLLVCVCVCVTFSLLTKLPLSQPTRFSSTSLPHPTTGEWRSDCMGLSCKLGLNHHITTLSPVFSTVKGKGH